jgi:hypothetical protein
MHDTLRLQLNTGIVTVPAPGDYDDGVIGGMIGKRN